MRHDSVEAMTASDIGAETGMEQGARLVKPVKLEALQTILLCAAQVVGSSDVVGKRLLGTFHRTIRLALENAGRTSTTPCAAHSLSSASLYKKSTSGARQP